MILLVVNLLVYPMLSGSSRSSSSTRRSVYEEYLINLTFVLSVGVAALEEMKGQKRRYTLRETERVVKTSSVDRSTGLVSCHEDFHWVDWCARSSDMWECFKSVSITTLQVHR